MHNAPPIFYETVEYCNPQGSAEKKAIQKTILSIFSSHLYISIIHHQTPTLTQ